MATEKWIIQYLKKSTADVWPSAYHVQYAYKLLIMRIISLYICAIKGHIINTYRISSDSLFSQVTCLSFGTFRTLGEIKNNINRYNQHFRRWTSIQIFTHSSARGSSVSWWPNHSTFTLRTNERWKLKRRVNYESKQTHKSHQYICETHLSGSWRMV